MKPIIEDLIDDASIFVVFVINPIFILWKLTQRIFIRFPCDNCLVLPMCRQHCSVRIRWNYITDWDRTSRATAIFIVAIVFSVISLIGYLLLAG
jgi:hypothetical protein